MNPARTLAALPMNMPFRYRLAAKLVLQPLARWRGGALMLSLPDGTMLSLGDPSSPMQIAVRVRDWRFFWRLLTAGDIGAGEAYMDGDWDCDDLVTLCRLFVRDLSPLDHRSLWTLPARLAHAVLRWGRTNTLRGSRRNITYHYDLSNDLYRLFLDESMMYSCAIFPSAESTLAEAQQHKIAQICHRLELAPGQHVLEIGSGWGALAIHAARTHGCCVTALTLSDQQQQLARERVAAAGLAERVDVRLCDYRDASGTYDAIVSIEMFEAVGHQYYGAFFGQCGRLLKPGGRMFVQTICVPDQRFEAYLRDFDWIRKYIFPGGALASVHAILAAVKRHTDMRLEWLHEIGPHYARTLRLWRERFMSELPAVRRLGFDDRFVRMWEFYLASCEAGFAERFIGDVQMVFARP